MTPPIRATLSAVVLAALAVVALAAGPAAAACPTNLTSFAPSTAADLQLALDCAIPGATISLAAGVTYRGNFVLRYKAPLVNGTSPVITIKSAQSSLLPAGHRVDPADLPRLATLAVPAGATAPVLRTELKTLPDGVTRRAASNYRFAGVAFVTGHWVNHLVRLGTATERAVAELPSNIGFDRSYFAGSPGEGAKQGLVANGRSVTVTNSWFRDFKDTANDAQAIVIWNGLGPYVIDNNHLEGSGENMMVGGGDPTISLLVPADITIRRNHFVKPLAWTFETSTQAGTAFRRKWRVKNLFELKNAQRVLVHGNVFENNWIAADQQGFAILFSTRNQSGGAPWSKIQDVTFTSNLIRNSTAGMKFLVTDDTFASGQLRNVLIQNNLLLNVNANAVPGTSPGDRAGRLFQLMNPKTTPGPVNLRVDRNTAFSTAEVSFSVWSPVRGVTFTNNVVRHNACGLGKRCGISGDGTAAGYDTLQRYFATATPPLIASCATFAGAAADGVAVCGNVFVAGGTPASYPVGNTFTASVTFGSTGIDPVTGLGPTGANYTVGDGTKGANWTAMKPYIDSALTGTPLQ